jgi:hypothetical protein
VGGSHEKVPLSDMWKCGELFSASRPSSLFWHCASGHEVVQSVCLVGVVNFVPYLPFSGKIQNYCIPCCEDELRVAVTMLCAGK